MTGREEMESRYERKIKDIIDKSPDIVRGFYNSLVCEYASAYEYLRHVKNFLEFTKKDVSTLNYDDFTEYLHEIRVTSSRRTTSSYQIVVYSALKKFCKYCYASGKISRNYMDDIERPKAVQSQETIEKRENGYLNQDGINEYLDNVINDNIKGKTKGISSCWKLRDYSIILLFLNTGMRCSALVNLNMEDVDIQNKSIRVTEKGNKSWKITNLSSELMDVLNEWFEERKRVLGERQCEAAFISARKTRITTRSVSRIVEKYATSIEGKHITPHKLRATFATAYYKETKDIRALKELLRHSNVQTTQIYTRGNNNSSAVAANIMGKVTHIIKES